MKRILGGLLLALVLLAGAAVHFLGPTMGAMLLGRPVFLFPPGPERYADTVISLAQSMAVNSDSAEFRAEVERVREKAREVSTPADLHDDLDALLKAAGGKHSGLVTKERLAEGTDTPPAVSRTGGVILATVPSIGRDGEVRGYADSLAHGIDAEAGQACGVIVDLRGNSGGDMGPMVAGLSALLPDGTVLEFVGPRWTTEVVVDGTSVQGGGTPLEVTGVEKRELPVAVLVDGETASSGEATMLTFRGLEDSRSFGAPTAGYASANSVFRMPDGADVMITVAEDRARTGEMFNDDPVIPDEETDDAEAAARDWLAGEFACRWRP